MNTTEFHSAIKPAILCLVDFSESSRAALEWSVREAQRQHSDITLLYPYRLNQSHRGEDLVKFRNGIAADAITNFEKTAKKTLDEAKIHYEFKPEVGFINDRVNFHSHRRDFAMLVISKSMAMTNRESMMELIDLIKFPLVIVPQNTPEANEVIACTH